MENSAGVPASGGERRLSVNVALDVGDAIETLAKRHTITIDDVIRRAISATSGSMTKRPPAGRFSWSATARSAK